MMPDSTSLFEHLETPAKTRIKAREKHKKAGGSPSASIPEEFRPHEGAFVKCIDCANFAGISRDKYAVLFKRGAGYCDWPGHPWGIWNVEQNILKPQHCAGFAQADGAMRAARAKAVEHYGLTDKTP